MELVIGGRPAERGELPWHAGIYRKSPNPYEQICGGSLVSATVVISAAHCFWQGTRSQPASNYAVALGKIYRLWNDTRDTDVQKFDVSELKIPKRFGGNINNFQEDIAVLKLDSAAVYRPHIRPVCVDFNVIFEKRQLREGNLGKIAGWGLTSAHGGISPILKVVDLPYVSIEQCQADSPLDFREYITGDKICAGYKNGTALCKGDSGGGLTFPDSDRGQTRYYLRGVVSTSPSNETLCNPYWFTTFTQLSRHESFITESIL